MGDKITVRQQLGEASMYCNGCMGKLYSFDGSRDSSVNCPTSKKCEEENNRHCNR